MDNVQPAFARTRTCSERQGARGTRGVHRFPRNAERARVNAEEREDVTARGAQRRARLCSVRRVPQAARGCLLVSQGGNATFVPSRFDVPLPVETSATVVALYRLDKGTITTADPSRTIARVDVTVTVGLAGARPRGWTGALEKTVSALLPRGGEAGRSVTVQLS